MIHETTRSAGGHIGYDLVTQLYIYLYSDGLQQQQQCFKHQSLNLVQQLGFTASGTISGMMKEVFNVHRTDARLLNDIQNRTSLKQEDWLGKVCPIYQQNAPSFNEILIDLSQVFGFESHICLN